VQLTDSIFYFPTLLPCRAETARVAGLSSVGRGKK
jgi:hypothetical protein